MQNFVLLVKKNYFLTNSTPNLDMDVVITMKLSAIHYLSQLIATHIAFMLKP